MVTNPDDSDNTGDEPADSGQESKSDNSFPLAALVASVKADIVPVEHISACSVEKLVQ